MRHDGGHLSIGLLPLLRQPHGEAAGILDVFLDVVLAEGRIGKHAIVTFEFVGVVLVLRSANSVFLADVGMGDPVEEHVHFADRPGIFSKFWMKFERVSSSSDRWPILRLKLIPLSTSWRASTFASSRASRALLRAVPTFVFK